ncbi:hypothetical protein CQW23_12290 [Capsicum baccatum]|uniref:Response regulatory domain-containing protein n=1 Tax=Capsicum baccatum TaxID=33114 RepID=A0A2G2WSB0_CAPBA|nr:hypothetical protein CQW23_12290 [Capsicum baccatum]
MTVEEIRGNMRGGDNFPIGMRVLVVVDDPICLKLLDSLLKKCQYQGAFQMVMYSLLTSSLLLYFLESCMVHMELDYCWIYQRNIDNRMGETENEDTDDEL